MIHHNVYFVHPYGISIGPDGDDTRNIDDTRTFRLYRAYQLFGTDV